jgi:DNA-binding GntR family transcriptional regulator
MSYFDSIYSSNLPSRAISVYMYLRHRANLDGQCWPSERRIGKDLSMSKSTVRRALHDLERSGYIQLEQRYRKTGAKSTLLFTLTEFKKRNTPKG